jgi:hypothetical protein
MKSADGMTIGEIDDSVGVESIADGDRMVDWSPLDLTVE